MVPLVMLVVMAGCAALLFLKGTLMQGIAMVFNAIIAGMVAFAFFETLARLLIAQSAGIAPWALLVCFLLLFILSFAVLQTAAMQLAKGKIDLGKLPEQIGRPACGVVLGYLVTGYLLVAVAMAPLPGKYPYARFDARNPSPSKPNKPILSPDGFVTALFATVSKGSFRALGEPRSFAVLHASYLDELYLNRHGISQKIPLLTKSPAFDVPRNGCWHAPDGLRDSQGNAVSTPPGEDLMYVRLEMKGRALVDAGKFTLSQVRLVCVPKGGERGSLAGQGHAVYPLGHAGANGRLERKPLDEVITLPVSNEAVLVDLVFSVPSSMTPALVQFKRNNVVQVPAVASNEDAPQPVPLSASASGERTAETGAPRERGRRGRQQEQEQQSETAPDATQERGIMERTRGLVAEPLDTDQ